MLDAYNDYILEEGNGSIYYFMEDLESVLEGCTAAEIVRMTYYGEFSPADDFFHLNAYCNLDSYSEGQIENMMRADRDFLRWYVEENDLIDWDSEEVKNDIEAANVLLAAGY